MKKLFFLTACFCLQFAKAQIKEGKVVYERVTQLQMRNFGNMPPELQAQLPKSRTEQFELLFTAGHSLYKFLPNVSDDGNNTFSSGGIVIKMAGGSGENSYIDLEKGIRTDQREVLEKIFLVTDTLARQQWKLSDETKRILQFTAHKATTTRINTRMRMMMENGQMKQEAVTDTANVVVWYTTDVPVAVGPDFAGQLPGLILEVNVANGQSITRAIEFEAKPVANKIKEPKDRKKLTAAEFTKERDKLMEEMRKNMPEGNRIRMN